MIIDREQFTRWLESKEPDEVVGIACSQSDCPVTRYATSMQKRRVTCAVTSQYLKIHDDYTNVAVERHADWLSTFIRHIDLLEPTATPVRASEALAIIKRLS